MELCEVLYNFTKENEDEIELKPGQIIEIISKHQEDPGWWKGIVDGRVGIFPENFVRIIKSRACSPSDSIRETFIAACMTADMARVTACLTLGVDINYVSLNDISALTACVLDNHLKLAEKLLKDENILVNTRTANSWTALMLASQSGKSQFVRLLCRAPGIDFNIQDEDGNTAGFLAVRHGQEEVVKVLAGMERLDWNIRGGGGNTALLYALKKKMFNIVKVLVRLDSLDLNAVDLTGENFISLAIKQKALWLLEMIRDVKDVDWNLPDSSGHCPLAAALKTDQVCMFHFLVTIPGIDLKQMVTTPTLTLLPECPVRISPDYNCISY